MSLVNSNRIYLIFGWASDGRPLIRAGHGWLNFVPARTAKRILSLAPGTRESVPFHTAAGWINYEVECREA